MSKAAHCLHSQVSCSIFAPAYEPGLLACLAACLLLTA